MADGFGLKVFLDGEKEFKSALADINAELKNAGSALELTQSQFQNSANTYDALTAKGTALSNVLASQQSKLIMLSDALQNARDAQGRFAESAEAARTNIANTERQLEALKGQTGNTSKEQEDLNKQLVQYKIELEDAEKGISRAERSENQWQTQINKTQIEVNNLGAEIEKNNQYMDEARQSSDGCATSIDKFGKEAKQAAAEVKTAGEDMKSFANMSKSASDAVGALAGALAAAGVTAAVSKITDVLIECVEATYAMQNAMAKLSMYVDEDVMSLGDLRGELGAVGNELVMSTAKLADAAGQAIAAGVDVQDASGFVKDAGMLAKAGFTDLSTGVDILTTVMNSYNMSAADSERVGSILVKTQQKGKISIEDMNSSLGKVIPTAASYGVKLENLITAYTAMSRNGLNARTATGALTSALEALNKSGGAVEKVLLEKTGRSFQQLMEDGMSLGDVMGILSNSVGNSEAAMNELFGSVSAGRAAFSIVNMGADEFNATMREMEDSSGTLQSSFNTLAETSEMVMARYEKAVGGLKVAIGNILAPELDRIREIGTSAFQWVTKFVKDHPELVKAISVVTAAVTALGISFAVFTTLTKILPVVTTLIKDFTAALNANPYVAAATAIITIGTAIVALVGAFDKGKTAADEFAEGLAKAREAREETAQAAKNETTSVMDSVTALERLAAKEEQTAGEKQTILALVDDLNQKVPELNLNYNEMTGELNMSAEAMREFVKAAMEQAEMQTTIENYKAALQDLYTTERERKNLMQTMTSEHRSVAEAMEEYYELLNEKYDKHGRITSEQSQRLKELEKEIGPYKDSLDTLNLTYTNQQREVAGLEKEVEGYAVSLDEAKKKQKALNDEMSQFITPVNNTVAAMEDLAKQYDDAYDRAYKSIDGQFKLFEKIEAKYVGSVEAAGSAVDDFGKGLDSQIEFMDKYEKNLKEAVKLGVDEGLIAKLSDGSMESAQLLDTIVQSGEDKIGELNEKFAKVEEGKDKFAGTVAEAETGFRAKMAEMVADLEKAMGNMDQADKWKAIGISNIDGLINGVRGKKQDYVALIKEVAQAGTDAYRSTNQQRSPSKVMYEIGQYDIQGLIDGAESKKAAVSDAYAGLAVAAVQTLYDRQRELREALDKLERDEIARQDKEKERQYLESLAELNDKLKKASKKDRQSILDQIKKMEADHAEELRKKKLKAQEDSLKAQQAALSEEIRAQESAYAEQQKLLEEALENKIQAMKENITQQQEQIDAMNREWASAHEDVARREESFRDKLASYGPLFEKTRLELGKIVDDQGRIITQYQDVFTIRDLQPDIDRINRFGDALSALRERGADKGLLNEILGMGVEDGTKFAEDLLNRSLGEFEAYQRQWQAKNEAAARVAREFFADEYAQLSAEYNDKLANMHDELQRAIHELENPDQAFRIGAENLASMIEGAESQRAALAAKYKSLAQAALDSWKKEMQQASPSKRMMEAGVFDIMGVIQGVLSKKADLEDAYGQAAKASIDAFYLAMPNDPISLTWPAVPAAESADGAGGFSITQNIYTPQYDYAEQQLAAAREFRQIARQMA